MNKRAEKIIADALALFATYRQAGAGFDRARHAAQRYVNREDAGLFGELVRRLPPRPA
jgi:hypothetical protein